MLPTEPLKIDLRRDEVVFAGVVVLADPLGIELEVSIMFLTVIIFRSGASMRSLTVAIAGAVPGDGGPD
jgi:hypothetical protein